MLIYSIIIIIIIIIITTTYYFFQGYLCHCGILSDNPSGEDSSYCDFNCPGNNSQKCGASEPNWQSVYHLPGEELIIFWRRDIEKKPYTRFDGCRLYS